MRLKLGNFELSIGRASNPKVVNRKLSASYDAAKTNHMNQKHWANADGLSADEANSPNVRRILRNRSRYERANNSYLEGMCDTYGEAVIATGARLNFIHDTPEVAEQVEQAFSDWAEGVNLTEKLQTAFAVTVGDGESFMVETRNPNERSPVTLDYRLLDAERCTNNFNTNTENNIDGVILRNGKPIRYTFSKDHPGNNFSGAGAPVFGNTSELRSYRADQVLHMFRKKRAEQHRGVPEITSALPLGSKRRAFALSTLEAAHIASTFSGVLHTTGSGWDDEDSDSDGVDNSPFDSFELENGTFMTLPKDWEMKQIKADHPSTTYKDFNRALIAETARSIGMPLNVALGDSSGFNFASGRLDRLSWRQLVNIRRRQVMTVQLYRIFTKWFEEARLRDGLLPAQVVGPFYTPRFTWFFDGDGAIDPVKEANAMDKNLSNGSMTYAEAYAQRGIDWMKAFRQRKKEQDFAETLGLNMGPGGEPTEDPVEEEENTPEGEPV